MIWVHFKWKVPYHNRNADPVLMALDESIWEFIDALPQTDVLAHRVVGGADVGFKYEEDALLFKLKYGC